MVLQGVSPMLLGTLSDRVGRRPIFLLCLALLTISCVGMALVPTDAYWLLVFLRCFQAAGSASTIALGSGTITDIAEPSERGGFLGAFSLGPLVGPSLGPIIGGLLTNSLGWRSIFWFLTIACGTYFVFFFIIFPETLRVLVGNGSIPPPSWDRPLIPLLTKYNPTPTSSRPPPKKFINPLLQFTHPSVVLLLFFNGTLYACFYGVTATLSTLFAQAYPFLNDSEIGLCFLAVGVGAAMGSFSNGKMLDADFKRIQRNLDKSTPASEKGRVDLHDGKLDAGFPIEYARLRLVPVFVALFVTSMIGYGWALQRRVHMACPLVLQFLVGWSTTCVMNTTQTLLMDLFHTQGSSITAANNLVRCSMGAVLVSIIDFILTALRPGWTYTLLGLICVAVLPLNWAVIRYGPRWRARRKQET
ncbi:major facilitator superfamily domain-containing protein [Gautieria morchelliformis]|nr:major facilitator superfamily domain-containing protein [Gautieria morchelliformis]